MSYGKALKLIRTSRNISQKELSVLVDVNPSYISLIEKGKRIPTIEIIEKIVKALDIPIHLFFLLSSDKEEVKKLYPTSNINKIGTLLLNILLNSDQTNGNKKDKH